MVAFSFAANFGAATRKVALLDVVHPDASRYHWPMLHRPGTGFPMYWWSFNQIEGLPEQIMAGRAWYLVDWLLSNSLVHPEAVSPADRAVYARAYDTPEAIRATNGWYRAIHQDIEDMATYGVLSVPMLGLVCPVNAQRFSATLPTLAKDTRVVVVEEASHWLAEDQPEVVARELVEFFR
jgi:pimeloyl-ACP methyl ester carboxylesterase